MSETPEIVTGEKPYHFRPLEAADVFTMSKIIGAIGVNEFAACFDADFLKAMGDKDDAADAVGATVFFNIASVIFKNLPRCEQDIYQMLANVSGMKPQEIKKLDFITFTEMVIDFVQKPEFRDFLKVVSRLFK